jgi:hypothetical protein
MIAAHIAEWALRRNKPSDAEMHVGGGVVKPKKQKARKKKERVLESKGGSQPMPAPPDPMAEASARDWEAQKAEERAAKQRAAQKEIDDAARATKVADWNRRKGSAYENAQTTAKSRLAGMGLENDPYNIMQMYRGNLDSGTQQLGELDDFSQLYGGSGFDKVLDEATQSRRGKTRRDFTNNFDRSNIDDTFADTADDSILDAIIGQQYEDSNASLAGARGRGQLTDAAYNRAVQEQSNRRSAARREAEDIGRGVLSSNRDRIGGMYDNTLSRVNNLGLADNFDTGRERGRVTGARDSAVGSLDADIRRAIGERQFFDPNSFIAKGTTFANSAAGAGGSSVGGAGATGNPLLNAFTEQQRNKQVEGAF